MKYTIRSHFSNPERYSPKNWTFEGSNDGINYVVLDTRVNEVNWGIWEKREYSFENTSSYTCYRINISKVTGESVAIEEIEMFEESIPESTELVSTAFPTKQQFQEKGMTDIPSYGQLSSFNDLLAYSTDNLSKSFVKFKPKEKTVLSLESINLKGKSLKKVSLTGNDKVKVFFTKDNGVTWSNKTGVFPISNISTQGLTPTQLSAITPDEWKTFMGDSSSLRFAYYLPDETANTDKLELTVDFVGE